tara:strand:+ start:316 stop:450 length:135 start_codon:yes stop_codon:yes gene_type:complete
MNMKMSELMKIDIKELKELEKNLWANWERASKALKVRIEIEEEE